MTIDQLVVEFQKKPYLLRVSAKIAAKRFNCTEEDIVEVRHIVRKSMRKESGPEEKKPEPPKEEFSYTEKERSAEIKGDIQTEETSRAKILDKFLEEHQVDLDKWEVSNYSISAHDVSSKYRDQDLHWKLGKHHDQNGNYVGEQQLMSGHAVRKNEWIKVTNYTIRVNLVKRKDFLELAIQNYIKQIPEFNFTHYIPKHHKGNGIALEVAPLDSHFGKLAWIEEVAYRNYDTNIASEDFEYAIDQQLSWASYHQPEKIFFIVGQDLFHVDNMKNHTTNGDHTMDVDGRMPKIYEKAFRTVTESIYKCRDMAPVEIIWSPGNHDYLASMFLCFALNEHFRNDKHVEVDIYKEKGKITRKARLWGNLLVGWTHKIKGRENTWGNELAQQFPKMWGESKFREWHCGDQHLKKTTKTTPEFTSGGVLIRQLTALSPVDKWHFENLFTDAVPGGEAFLWSKDVGVFSNLMAWTGQYEKNRNDLVKNNHDKL